MEEIRVEDWKRGDPIEYIREEIPEFEVPGYDGERYEAWVPDTLDLQERAELAVHGLTEPTDALADYEIYWLAFFAYNPPMMQHDYSDGCQAKFMEALPLMRIMSGSSQNEEVDQRWMEVALHLIGPDGLPYWPKAGRPWALFHSGGSWEAGGLNADARHFTLPWATGRLMGAMSLYGLRGGGQPWEDTVRGVVDGLAELAIERDDYAYFREGAFGDNQPRSPDAPVPTGRPASQVGWTIQGLAQAYRVMGYEPARELGGKLVRYLRDHGRYYGADGRFLPKQVGEHPTWVHFQHHVLPMVGMTDFALATDDRELMEFLQKAYEYGRANGEPLTGYFGENLGSEELEHSEICEVANMMAVGVKLAQAGVADNWDDVDRWTRNMFAEGQLTPSYADWLDRFSADQPLSAIDAIYQSSERVAERNIGSFAGWPKANDWYAGVGPGIMHCCTGNGTRALYYVWEHIVTYDGGKLRVNLLLNRASRWADVDSHIPYVGQVDVKIKEPVDLSIRIPEWVKPGEVRVQVDGADREVGWDGRYAEVGEVKPGEVATMTFPIAERADAVWIEKEKYTLVRKGNDVVAIDPPGRYCPLYQRDHYRVNTTRWRKIERFVSKEAIYW